MPYENRAQGKAHYGSGDPETRAWFERQWKIWPNRAHPERTTNISFHYGGVLAFREEHSCEPKISRDLASHVAWFDKQEPRP